MKPILLAVALALLPVSASAAITSECLPSLAAALAAHPRDHVAWSGPRSDRCFFKGHRGDRSVGKRKPAAPRAAAAAAPVTVAQPAPASPAPVQISPKEAIEAYVLAHAATLYQRAVFPRRLPEVLAKLREAGR